MTPRLVLLAILLAFASAVAAERPPNFVIIFIDDMGYADIGPFGAKATRRRNLDRMAKEGRVFTDFYVPQAVCSASRAGLMTGCYNVRVGISAPWARRPPTASTPTRSPSPRSQAEGLCHGLLRQVAPGPSPASSCPLQHGFDEYFGLPYSNDMWPLPSRRVRQRFPASAADRRQRRGQSQGDPRGPGTS